MEYTIEDLTKEDAEYIGEKINEIVPREVDAEAEEFVLKVENENGEIIGGCIAEAYEYRWARMHRCKQRSTPHGRKACMPYPAKSLQIVMNTARKTQAH